MTDRNERTPSSRELLTDMVSYSRETAENMGRLMGKVQSLDDSVRDLRTRLDTFATRDELDRALKGRSMRPQSTTLRKMLPWVLGVVTSLAAAVGGWLASGCG